MRAITEIRTTIPKAALLSKLHENRINHRRIVEEARDGYLKRAQTALEARMKQLASGEIVALHFDLQLPQDYTKEYDTVIGMLEMGTDTEITLSASEYRTLVEDEWDWLHSFLASNAGYSMTAVKTAKAKGW